MAKISLKKDYMDGNVLYGKDLNPNFETIETTINDNDDAQAGTNAEVEEALTQLSSDMTQAQTDIGELQEEVTSLESGITGGDSATLESAKSYTDTKLQGYAKTTDVPTKISQLENDDNTVKDASYVHTDNNFSNTDKTKLDSLNNYELPIASTSILGGIKLGEGLEAEADGTVNVTGGTSGEGIPTLTGTQEAPVLLYMVQDPLVRITGWAKETSTSEATYKFSGKLMFTTPSSCQVIGPIIDNGSHSLENKNLKFYVRPLDIWTMNGYRCDLFADFTYKNVISDEETGYVTPKAVYDYVGALASLNTTDKSSIVNAINELVNSSGTPGKDGLDYLGYYNATNFSQEPYIGQTFTHQISNFSRTPVIGDTYIMLGSASYGNHSYLITCEVTDVSETHGTVSSKIVTFVETTGEQGLKGDTGETGPQGPQGETGATGATGPQGEQGPQGPQGDPGPAGADGTDGVTPTIGENGNWYLGETDTGKPSRGEQGLKGDTGEQGPQGLPGPTGPGVPTGGLIGQVLSKIGNGDYETGWQDATGGSLEGINIIKPEEGEVFDLATLSEEGIYYCINGKSTNDDRFTNKGFTNSPTDKGYGNFIVIIFTGTQSLNDSYKYRCRIDIGSTSMNIATMAVGSNDIENQTYTRTSRCILQLQDGTYLDSNVYPASSKAVNTVAKAISSNTSSLPALSTLQTTDKSSLIAAINELNTRLAALENPTE